MMCSRFRAVLEILAISYLSLSSLSIPVFSQPQKSAGGNRPWMNTSLSPDERADLVIREMTFDEKIQLIHGNGMPMFDPLTPVTAMSNRGGGYVVGIPRLGIPAIDMCDAAYGVRGSAQNGRYSTALPSDVALAASWDTEAGFDYGSLIGRELRAQGYNMSLGGGVNLTRDPRDGRTFEYLGEDPVLAGTMVARLIAGVESQHVIGDIKHYAFNDQESGRGSANVLIGERAARESDLLAFEIGVEQGHPGAVMCAYNRVNGVFSCENRYLLNEVLKKDWKFPGFVLSDWGGTHSLAKASAAGLDHEEGGSFFYGDRYKAAVQSGSIPMTELDEHVHRILRSMFAAGVVDYPQQRSVVDPFADLQIARSIEEDAIVLLKNDRNVLPLDAAKIRTIAVIGAHSDAGMISGGGSAQVDPPGEKAFVPSAQAPTPPNVEVWFPTSPLKAIQQRAPHAIVKYNSGADSAAAAAMAKGADIAIVFAYQWESEGMDLPNLSLPLNQDSLIAQVAAANPHTIVVLETGGPVTMPWVNAAAAILEAWYAGSDGANALGNVLFGTVNPSGKLPITFPKSVADLPHPALIKPPLASIRFSAPVSPLQRVAGLPPFTVDYNEGVEVGYKWYDAENKSVLFPFGYGLSYTSYRYSDLTVTSGKTITAAFTVTNTGARGGSEIAEVYASLPTSAHEPPKRLVGWTKVKLIAGEKRAITVQIDPKYLSIFDVQKNAWMLVPGSYTILAGGSLQDLPLKTVVNLR